MNGQERVGRQPGACVPMKELIAVVIGACRMEIICRLRHRPQTVSAISSAMELEIATVSHHLRILHENALLQRKAVGTRRVYSLSKCVRANVQACGMVQIELKGADGEKAIIQCRLDEYEETNILRVPGRDSVIRNSK